MFMLTAARPPLGSATVCQDGGVSDAASPALVSQIRTTGFTALVHQL